MRTRGPLDSPKVLVVDDERAIATSLATILERNGYRALSAFDGEEAVFVAEQFVPDCLVCDVVMPGIDGVETALAITHILPNCKVLLISGQARCLDLLEKAPCVGFDFELVAKPIEPDHLLRRVAALLAARPTASRTAS